MDQLNGCPLDIDSIGGVAQQSESHLRGDSFRESDKLNHGSDLVSAGEAGNLEDHRGSVAIGSIVARMGGKPLEVCHHLNHGIGIDGRIVPLDPIGSLPQHPSDLPVGHATDEFLPWGLIGAAVLNTCLGSVVEELIVADPKGSIPGLVICPTVVGVAGHEGEVVWFFLILQATQPPEGGQVDSLRTGSVAPGFGHPMR